MCDDIRFSDTEYGKKIIQQTAELLVYYGKSVVVNGICVFSVIDLLQDYEIRKSQRFTKLDIAIDNISFIFNGIVEEKGVAYLRGGIDV